MYKGVIDFVYSIGRKRIYTPDSHLSRGWDGGRVTSEGCNQVSPGMTDIQLLDPSLLPPRVYSSRKLEPVNKPKYYNVGRGPVYHYYRRLLLEILLNMSL